MPQISKAHRQVVEMQEGIFETAKLLREDAKLTTDRLLRTRSASALAMLAKAWESMEDRKRILRGKPLPGSLRPERKSKPAKRTHHHAPTEAQEQPEPQSTRPIAENISPSKESLSPQPDPPAPDGGGRE